MGNDPSTRFDQRVLVHLDAGYNLAHWLTRDATIAEDALQDACVRALRFFESQAGPNPKAWFLAIVRNACLDRLRERRQQDVEDAFDEDVHGLPDPETPADIVARASDARWLRRCIEKLPVEYREVVVLRELEELSYKEISTIVDVPIGTVMSRLSRGRDALAKEVLAQTQRRKA